MVVADHLAGTGRENPDHVVLGGRQDQRPALQDNPSFIVIDDQIVNLKWCGRSGYLAQRGLDPSDQFRRHTTYGYDQRLEVHGAKGMLRAENRPETSLVRYTAAGALHDRLLSGPPDGSQFYFYKYAEAYPSEMNHFVESLEAGDPPMVSVEDGYRSQLLVEAAVESLKTNRPVQVAE